jgi:hypothetical protein
MYFQELYIDPNPHHHELNPAIWDGNAMRTEVRHQLLKIAKNFIEFLEEPNLKLKDVTLSGSSAGYNYSEYSDMDLHLVVNSDKLFTPQKVQYNNTYDLKIRGIPVELYVQPAGQTHHSAGIYSVLDNKWITEPKHEEPTVPVKDIRAKARSYAHKINSAMRSGDLAKCKEAMEDLKRLRKAGLETNGEQSVENLAFKLLRARGQIEKLRKYIHKLESAELSLGEHNED